MIGEAMFIVFWGGTLGNASSKNFYKKETNYGYILIIYGNIMPTLDSYKAK